ncbi:MAG: suppressor of fused domain protein [Pedobacter sp.]|uniref:suppressor of fused domain protein n=1 Tax=Pedobacter sp. TaxID=1411316 RepID=UPI00280A331C|nr:suppressor of fused domain protein [Pedobacter sp.]MDQ8004617.1 suppressor of fused domain protein [Pedobacter sp.]
MNDFYEKFRNRANFDEHAEAIADHLDKYYKSGEITVFHEIFSPDLHLDVYFVQSEKHNFNILLTAGMSTLQMSVPAAVENPKDYQFAELMLLLPKSITFGKVTGDNPNDWLIAMLKEAARFPHHYDTWLSIGHTLQATADMEPYAENTNYTGVVILPSVTFDEEFTSIQAGENLINIYSVFPLYADEMNYKIENGYNALLDKLIEKNAKEIFDDTRANLLS